MLRNVKIGNGALVLEPWALKKRKRENAKESWSPFEGSKASDHAPLNNWSIARMRRQNKSLNREALNFLGIVPKDHVLEIGYGSGEALTNAAKMARNGFAAGIDRSIEMLHAGHKRAEKSKAKNLTVLRGDISWLPWSACAFDKAFVVDGITEWPCTRSGLEEVYRTLRPGGSLVIAEKISGKFTKSKALALAHLLNVVGFEELEVKLVSNRSSEMFLLKAVRI